MTASPLHANLTTADLILIAAEGSGFPMPFSVAATEYSLTLQFHDGIPAEWIEWASSPEVIVDQAGNGSGHRAHGTLFDRPVELTAWVKA